MRTRLCICAVLGLAFFVLAESLRADSDQKASRIAGLIKQLGDEDFILREEAHTALEALGELALDALRKSAASTKDAEVQARAGSILNAAGVVNSVSSSAFEPQAADFEFLRNIKGKSRKAVLGKFGPPHVADWHPEGFEQWTYYRTDGKLFWVFFRQGIATSGMPTDGLQIGGQEFKF